MRIGHDGATLRTQVRHQRPFPLREPRLYSGSPGWMARPKPNSPPCVGPATGCAAAAGRGGDSARFFGSAYSQRPSGWSRTLSPPPVVASIACCAPTARRAGAHCGERECAHALPESRHRGSLCIADEGTRPSAFTGSRSGDQAAATRGPQGMIRAPWSAPSSCLFATLPLPIAHALGATLGLIGSIVPNSFARRTRFHVARCLPELGRLARARLVFRARARPARRSPSCRFCSPRRSRASCARCARSTAARCSRRRSPRARAWSPSRRTSARGR